MSTSTDTPPGAPHQATPEPTVPPDSQASAPPEGATRAQAQASAPRKVVVPIQRAERSERQLPLIAADMYEAAAVPAEGATPGQRLLGLAARPIGLWQRTLGQGLPGDGRLARLVWLHAQGLAAERAGQERRATFYWERALTELKAMWGQPLLWARAPAGLDEPRRRVLEELFIDTHCALYNGHLGDAEPPRPASRGLFHADRVLALTRLPGLDEGDYLAILGPLHEACALAYEAGGQPQQAITHREELARLYPDQQERQEELAAAHLQGALAGLSTKMTPATALADAAKLYERIASLERRRQAAPYTITYYDALAQLCHLRAVRLSNASLPSEALEAVQKALAYNPGLEQAYKTRDKLLHMLEVLQAQMRAVEATLARNRRAHLNAHGERIKADLQRGLRPARRFSESPEASTIAEQRAMAEARSFWHQLGLPAPANRFDQRAVALVPAVVRLLEVEPYDARAVLHQWGQLAAESADLADLDSGPVLSFVHRRRTGAAEPSRAPAFTAPADPPRLAPAPRAVRQQEEPLDLWVFSRQDMRLKLLAVCATLLVALALGLTFAERSNQATRDRAYTEVLAAAAAADYNALMDAGADFLAHQPLSGQDPRSAEVRELYEESFVRWFVTVDESGLAAAQGRIGEYQAVVAARQ